MPRPNAWAGSTRKATLPVDWERLRQACFKRDGYRGLEQALFLELLQDFRMRGKVDLLELDPLPTHEILRQFALRTRLLRVDRNLQNSPS